VDPLSADGLCPSPAYSLLIPVIEFVIRAGVKAMFCLFSAVPTVDAEPSRRAKSSLYVTKPACCGCL